MTRYLPFLVVVFLLALSVTSAGAAAKADSPKECGLCRMDLNTLARSRMLITYADGTTMEVCSLYCAIEAMKRNEDKQVKTLQVADYPTKELIDARRATWVVGGTKPGGMNYPPKWAFASEEDARKFVRENGGIVTPYERVTQPADQDATGAADNHSAHHAHVHMDAGGSMLFNPAFGEDIYHAHPVGMWMANYKFMHMAQRGLRNGTTDVPAENATSVENTPFGFMMAPTGMTMDMHMLMVMYGVTDRFTLMGMATYLDNEMEMVMNMGAGNVPDAPMKTSGPGDTELRGIYKVGDVVTASLGIGIPTGNIDQEIQAMGQKFRAPYDMQLGSGTIDLKPALTYSVLSDDLKWNAGGQASYTFRTGRNDNGYAFGDSGKVTGWLQRALGPAATWLRLAYGYTGRIAGRDSEIDRLLDPATGAPTPDANPDNYGGHRVDGFLGASYAVGAFSVGVEAGIPLYQYLNGLQLKNEWYLTAGIQGML